MNSGADLLGLIDPKVTFGNLIEVATILGGGVMVLMRMRTDLGGLKANDDMRSKQIDGIETELKKISEVLTHQAVLDTRLAAAEQDIRDMQRGRGFITRERPSVDGEYP